MDISFINTSERNLYIKASVQSWITCLSCSLFVFYEFIQIHMLNSLLPYLIYSFHPTVSELSFVSSSYLYSCAIFIPLSGCILDYVNTKKFILLMMSLSIIGTFLLCQSQSILMIGIARLISGAAGGSTCFISTLHLISRYFPKHQYSLTTGVVLTISMLGGIAEVTPNF